MKQHHRACQTHYTKKLDQANYHEIKDSGHCPQIQQPEKLLSLILGIL
ncbi:MAG: hypothetical protein CM15mP117_25460 [Alphaproteobacteria bacterium]|nr:MAG: hypothetical protein CM15mP117_25460 [Alphaproteobacteria bacterium]